MIGWAYVPVALQLPIGAEADFTGIIDLVRMRAYLYPDELGLQVVEGEIPDDWRAQAEEYRELLIEAAAEGSDELTQKYLDGIPLTEDEIRAGIRALTLSITIVPRPLWRELPQQGCAAIDGRGWWITCRRRSMSAP